MLLLQEKRVFFQTFSAIFDPYSTVSLASTSLIVLLFVEFLWGFEKYPVAGAGDLAETCTRFTHVF